MKGPTGMAKSVAWMRKAAGLLCTSLLALSAGMGVASPPADQLLDGFESPPQEARPRLWWHWMGGNISEEGARLDLEWMQRIGIGGVHAFSGGKLPTPAIVKPPKPFMSGEWQKIFSQSLTQAHGAGMEFGIAASPGWSETGGPWVAPADGMKKYVWSETVVEGGRPFRGQLPSPPSVIGPFQGVEEKTTAAAVPPTAAYGDAAVIAFPTPRAERTAGLPEWNGPAGPADLGGLASPVMGGGSFKLPLAPDGSVLEARFPAPVQIGALVIGVREGARVALQVERAGRWDNVTEAMIEASSDQESHPAPQETLSFTPVKASHFRLRLLPLNAEARTAVSRLRPQSRQKQFTITRLALQGGGRVNGFEAKAGFQSTIPGDAGPSVPVARADAVAPSKVIDLTGRLRPDGTLDWTPPAGSWTVLRFGWSLTGAVNAPAEPGATGLEVDKYDPAAVTRYLDTYLGMYDRASGNRLGPDGVQSVLTDSWEAGVQNWTPRILEEFRARRGYDATPYLPVLTGRIVGSSALSEAFLFDFRSTLKDMAADNHHAVLARTFKARGMRYYAEAQGDFPRAIADGMTLKARADIPTAEYWYRPFATIEGQPPLRADLQEAASVAHIYGKPYAAAEALTVGAVTDPWSFSPAMLRPVADQIFARGINRLLLHESLQQPLVDAKPGSTLFIFGQNFTRNESWAEQAKPWIDYLSRTSYLLQQGQYVADIAYFYGEERSLTEQFLYRLDKDVPDGFGYDYVNPEALLTLLSVRDGRIVTQSGMSYRILYIPGRIRHYSLPVLRKIRDLVKDGAVLVASPPQGGLGVMSPDAEVQRLAAEIWGGKGPGRGRVYTSLDQALAAERISPDVSFKSGDDSGDDSGNDKGDDRGELLSLHRRTADSDIYFISNQDDRAKDLWATFRVNGRVPEMWKADSGATAPVSYRQLAGGTDTRLKLDAHESAFIVFRKAAAQQAWDAPEPRFAQLATLDGPWRLSFEAGRGAPAAATFGKLTSWTDSADAGIKYFSGTARYERTLDADPDWFRPGRKIRLDLGEVRDLANVTVNGTSLGILWHAPYSIDIEKALKPGKNRIEISVTNLWPNRLIGDKQPGAKPVAFAPSSPYRADSPLLPSGLLGPVHIVGVDAGDGSGR